MLLPPPPPAPPRSPSFQTCSLLMVVPDPSNFVPPQARAKGLEDGKSVCGFLSLKRLPCASVNGRSEEPLSPEAQQIVTPSVAASWRIRLKALRYCCVEKGGSSGPPQLIEITEGLRMLS